MMIRKKKNQHTNEDQQAIPKRKFAQVIHRNIIAVIINGNIEYTYHALEDNVGF